MKNDLLISRLTKYSECLQRNVQQSNLTSVMSGFCPYLNGSKTSDDFKKKLWPVIQRIDNVLGKDFADSMSYEGSNGCYEHLGKSIDSESLFGLKVVYLGEYTVKLKSSYGEREFIITKDSGIIGVPSYNSVFSSKTVEVPAYTEVASEVEVKESNVYIAASGEDIIMLQCNLDDIKSVDDLFWVDYFNNQCGLDIFPTHTIVEIAGKSKFYSENFLGIAEGIRRQLS